MENLVVIAHLLLGANSSSFSLGSNIDGYFILEITKKTLKCFEIKKYFLNNPWLKEEMKTEVIHYLESGKEGNTP